MRHNSALQVLLLSYYQQGVGQLVGCCRDKAFTCEFYLIQARHMEPFIWAARRRASSLKRIAPWAGGQMSLQRLKAVVKEQKQKWKTET